MGIAVVVVVLLCCLLLQNCPSSALDTSSGQCMQLCVRTSNQETKETRLPSYTWRATRARQSTYLFCFVPQKDFCVPYTMIRKRFLMWLGSWSRFPNCSMKLSKLSGDLQLFTEIGRRFSKSLEWMRSWREIAFCCQKTQNYKKVIVVAQNKSYFKSNKT